LHEFYINTMVSPINQTTIKHKKHIEYPATFAGMSFATKIENANDSYKKEKNAMPQWKILEPTTTLHELNEYVNTNFEELNPNYINPMSGNHWFIDILNKRSLNAHPQKMNIIKKIVSHPDFDPNFRENEQDTPLLYKIVRLPHKLFAYGLNTQYGVIETFVAHPDFNPNDKFTDDFANNYVMLGLRTDCTALTINMLSHPKFKDPYEDDFATITMLAKNYESYTSTYLENILNELREKEKNPIAPKK